MRKLQPPESEASGPTVREMHAVASTIDALKAENERLREECARASREAIGYQQRNDLFNKCVARALTLWQEKHPDEKMWPDAAKNICWLAEENERLRADLAECGKAGCDDLKDAKRDIETLRMALQRFVDLEGACDYTNEILPPNLCPGIAENSGMCHWCQARAALDLTEQ